MFRFNPILILLLSLFSVSTGHSQDNKIEEYIKKCEINFRNSDSLFHYSNLLLQFDNNKAKEEGYYARGYAFRNKMQLDSALFYFDKSSTYTSKDDYTNLSRIARLSSITATHAGDFEKAFLYSKKMKDLASDKGDSLAFALAVNQEGVIFKNKGDLNNAINKYTTAGKIQKLNNFPQLPYTYTNIAVAYSEMKQDSLSLIWFQRAYKSAQEFKDSTIITRSINNLGNYFKIQKNTDSSLFYFNKLLKNEKSLASAQRSLLHQNLADLYNRANNPEKAIYFYNKAEPVVNNGQNPRRKIELLTVLLQIEKGKKNNAEKVLAISDSLIGMIQSANIPNKLLPIYLDKAEALKELGKFEKAVFALDRYNRIKDSLSRFQDAATIQRIVSEFELAEKEIELQAALVNDDGSTKAIIINGVLTLCVVLIITFLYNRSHIARNKKNINSQENDQTKKQFTLKTGRIVKCEELAYVKSDGHYLEYYLLENEQPILERNRLKNRLEELRDCNFVQTHRSYIVNAEKIKTVYSTSILLEKNIEIPLSRSFKQKLKEEENQTLFQ